MEPCWRSAARSYAPLNVAPLSLSQRTEWADLLGVAFNRPSADVVRVLDAMHDAYPVVAWGVWDGATLAAQYSCLLKDLHVPGSGSPVSVGLSVNMAVHPDYRGRGLVKLAAEPVYEAVRAAGGVAGVGFSNAQGVRVDRRSRSYGYQVVGRLRSTLAIMVRPPQAEPVSLTDSWPGFAVPEPQSDRLVRFGNPVHALKHRYAEPRPVRYRFGLWTDEGALRGAVAYRGVRWRGVRAASLLAAYSDDVESLVARWARAQWDEGVRAIHTLTSPKCPVRDGLRRIALTAQVPLSRSPYYLTVKPLGPEMPAMLLDFARWDCMGGDIL